MVPGFVFLSPFYFVLLPSSHFSNPLMKKSQTLRHIWYSLSPGQRAITRRLYYLLPDIFDRLTNRRHKYVPPRGYIFTGSSSGSNDFIAQGMHQLNILKAFISLKPDDHVLDVGCGIGRTAIALTTYLNSNGKYCGFDAVEKGIKWCNRNITKDFPNFHFSFVPLYNDLYTQSGLDAGKFVFPFPGNSFDKVFLFSVFTHMQIHEIENYLKEIKRLLKPGGKSLATVFVYDENNEAFIANRKDFGFPVKMNGYRLMSSKVKSSNIAISEATLSNLIESSGLVKEIFIDGFWKNNGKEAKQSEYQDILVLSKEVV